MNELIPGTIGAPKDLPADAVGSVGTPNTLPADSAGIVGTPNTVPADGAGIIAAPISLPSQGAAALPRSLTPMVEFDFAAKRYVQDGVAVAFEDIFTYTRASSATFTNRRAKKNGGYEYFLDTDYVGSVTNLITYSEDFSDADWSKSTTSVQSNVVDSPYNNFTADKLLLLSTSGNILSTATTSNESIASVYIKAGSDITSLQFRDGNGGVYSFFNLVGNNFTVGLSTANQAYADYIKDGWWKLSIVVSSFTSGFRIALNGSTGGFVYIWGAQLTESAKPLPYVKTLDVAVTKAFAETLRTEYDAVTGKNLGALIEGGSTNLCTHSESMGATGWHTGTLDTILQNVKKAPDDTFSMNSITSGATIGSSYIRRDLPLVSGVTYTVSVYASSNDTFTTGNVIKVTSPSDGSLLTIGLATAGLTSETKRYTGTFTSNTTETHYIYFGVDADANKTIEVWGAQFEGLPFATSYIRTEGSAVSRSSDNLSLPASGNFNASEYSVVAGFDIIGGGENVSIFAISDATSSNRILSSSNAIDDKVRINVKANGVESAALTSSVGIITNTSAKSTITFSSGIEKLYANGLLDSEDLTTISPSELTVINIGSRNSFGYPIYGHISKFSTYAQALTAQEITLL